MAEASVDVDLDRVRHRLVPRVDEGPAAMVVVGVAALSESATNEGVSGGVIRSAIMIRVEWVFGGARVSAEATTVWSMISIQEQGPMWLK